MPALPITAYVYDRAPDPYGLQARHRVEATALYAAQEGWEMGGRWIDTGDAVLTPRCRPELDAMLDAIVRAPRGTASVVLVTSWTRFAHSHAGRQHIARRILGTGAWIETVSGEAIHPDGRRIPAGGLGADPVLL